VNARARAAALFEVHDPSGAPDENPEETWSVVHEPPDAVSFGDLGAADTSDDAPLVVRVRLPDRRTVESALAAESRQLDVLDASLGRVQGRVESVLARDGMSTTEGVSFDVTSAHEVPAAEQALLGFLHPDSASVSFEAGAESEESPSKIEAFLDNLLRRATRMARVETVLAGREIATTDVTILGDTSTQLRPGVSRDDVRVHTRALDAVLRKRRSWVTIVMKTLQTAALLSTANPFIALPAAWRFIRDVQAEVKKLEEAEAA
jgi:hypothetical protein